jgi:hypothetical protein
MIETVLFLGIEKKFFLLHPLVTIENIPFQRQELGIGEREEL